MSAITAEDFIKFFEETTGKKCVDVDSGKPVLDIITEQKAETSQAPSGADDYDQWLAEQDEEIQAELRTGEL